MIKDLDFDLGDLRAEFLTDTSDKIVVRNLNSYDGPERRSYQRRSDKDRRAHLRFQPGKCIDRRDTPERRKSASNTTPSL